MMQPKSRVKIVSTETLSNGWTKLSSPAQNAINEKTMYNDSRPVR